MHLTNGQYSVEICGRNRRCLVARVYIINTYLHRKLIEVERP